MCVCMCVARDPSIRKPLELVPHWQMTVADDSCCVCSKHTWCSTPQSTYSYDEFSEVCNANAVFTCICNLPTTACQRSSAVYGGALIANYTIQAMESHTKSVQYSKVYHERHIQTFCDQHVFFVSFCYSSDYARTLVADQNSTDLDNSLLKIETHMETEWRISRNHLDSMLNCFYKCENVSSHHALSVIRCFG